MPVRIEPDADAEADAEADAVVVRRAWSSRSRAAMRSWASRSCWAVDVVSIGGMMVVEGR